MATEASGDYSIEAAVALFSQKASDIIALWAMFVNATLLAAAFSYGLGQAVNIPQGTTVRILCLIGFGYISFTIGHLTLLLQAIAIKKSVADDIKAAIGRHKVEASFSKSLTALTHTVNPPWFAIICHLTIDACVIASIVIAAVQRYPLHKPN